MEYCTVSTSQRLCRLSTVVDTCTTMTIDALEWSIDAGKWPIDALEHYSGVQITAVGYRCITVVSRCARVGYRCTSI